MDRKSLQNPTDSDKGCSDRKDLSSTGVYLLFGRDNDDNNLVYIGEAENILVRLNQHIKEKEFWTETIFFISKDENLNKAHIKYLESRLYEIASEIGRYIIVNDKKPTKSSISESEVAEMEEFLDNIKLLVNNLGHKLFEDKRENNKSIIPDFYIKAARGADAIGKSFSDGFVVYKGSKITKEIVKSYSKSFIIKRDNMNDKGVFKDNGNVFELQEDYVFSSPSTAAAIVMGRNANGLTEWKTKDGLTLKDYEVIE